MKLTKQASDGDIYALIEDPHLLLPYIRELVRVIPDIRFFVRRLSWIALNMPVNINGRQRQEASSLLSGTVDNGQVLPNYWMLPNNLLSLFTQVELDTFELDVFWGKDMQSCGSIKYFEYTLWQNPFPGSKWDLSKLMEVLDLGIADASEFAELEEIQFYNADRDYSVKLADSALAQASELLLYTTLETLQSGCELHVSEGASSELFSELSVWREGGARYVSADVMYNSEDVQTVSVLEESEKYHPTVESLDAMPYGTILYLDEQGQILSGAEKHVGDPLWTMFSRQ